MEQWIVTNKKADFKGIGDRFGIDQVTARIIRNRDIIEDEDIRLFLRGGLKDLHDPSLLHDADRTVEILIDKIKNNKSIRIIGDYDIDGVMSTYILVKALDACGAKVSYAIPERIRDGYGLNINLIDEAYKAGIDTIVTCDNGIAAIEEINHAKALGMTVLVTDHHEIPYDEADGQKVYLRSEADAIVNPHQAECRYPFKDLCGAAVAWKVVCLLYRRLDMPENKEYEFLENVAFATVGDIMNLKGENRILVKAGLKAIHQTRNIGMNELIKACGLEAEQVDAYHFGYVLGPCINASGRLDTAKRALEILLETDPDQAAQYALELVKLNAERKDMTQEGVDQAKAIYEEEGYDKYPVIVIYMPEVHESIAGIIAGRIREAYNKPTFILTDGAEYVKGSGRSIEDYSMYEEMCKCKELFVKFGGHPMAAGLSLTKENVDNFREEINKNCSLTEEQLMEKVKIDVPMPVSYVTMELVREFGVLAPFGKANPRPVFADRNISVERMWIVGQNRNVLRLSLRSEDGRPVSAIYFGDFENFKEYILSNFGIDDYENALKGRNNSIKMDFVYSPKINNYRGEESLQFEIQYYR